MTKQFTKTKMITMISRWLFCVILLTGMWATNTAVAQTCTTATGGTLSATPTGPFCFSAATTINTSVIDTGSGLNYQWQSSATGAVGSFANMSGQTNTSLVLSGVTASTYYRLVVVCANGPLSDTSAAIQIVVNALPTVGAAVLPSATVCAGTSVTLNGTGAVSYSWDNGVTNGVPFTANTTTTYTVTGTDANGCQNTATQTVTVNGNPTASIAAGCTSVYTGQTTTLTATAAAGSGTISTYQWVLNGSTNVGTNSSTYSTSTPGSYTVTVTNSNGCSVTSNAVVITNNTSALSGAYAIPGTGNCTSFPTISAFVNALNAYGISASVTANVATGYTETAPLGGYNITATGTASNTITFNGGTATITAFSPQTAGSQFDGIFKIIGGDYITIQNFTLKENNGNTVTTLATNTMTDFAIGVFYNTATDGAQNVTIQNNVITMGATNQNALGILSTTANTATSVTAALATATTGLNNNLKIYGNTISSVAFGIQIIAPPATASVTTSGIDIGGSSSATGNTITYGVNTAATSTYNLYSGNGVRLTNVIGVNCRFNTINTISGYTQANTAISVGGTTPVGVTYTNTISNNTIVMNMSNATNNGIDFGYGLATGTIVGSNNNITINLSSSATSSATATGIKAAYATATNTCNSNTVVINETFTPATALTMSGAMLGITLAGTGTTLNATNNNVTINQFNSPSAAVVGTLSSSATGISFNGTATTVNSNGNTILFNQVPTAIAGGTSTISGAIVGIQATTAEPTINIGTTIPNTVTVKQAASALGTTTYSGAVTYVDLGSAAHGTANVVGNTFNTTGSTVRSTAQLNVINDVGTVSVLYNFKNNTVNIDRIAASGSAYFSYQTTTPSNVADTVSLNNITFTNISGSSTVTAINQIGGPSATGGNKSIYGNIINISGTNTGATKGISVGYGLGKVTSNNIIINNLSTAITGIDLSSTSAGAFSVYGNKLSLVTASVASNTIIGVNGTATGPFQVYSNNLFSLSSTGGGAAAPTITGINVTSASSGNNIYNNTFTNLSASGPSPTGAITINGIVMGATTSNSCYSNVISNISTGATTGAATINGISITGGTTNNVYLNKIYDLNTASTNTVSIISDISVGAGTTNTIYNNYIGQTNALTGVASLTNVDAVRGINITSSTASSSTKLYYNTIYLATSSTGANFSSSAVFHTFSTTATTSALDMRDNIIINKSTPSGTGISVAFRRSASTNLNNYATTSNNNLFYAGTPSASNLVYYDGTNSCQAFGPVGTAGTMKNIVTASREANSFTEAVSNTAGTYFQSFLGTSTSYLHLVNGLATLCESGGVSPNTTTYSTDYDGDIRAGSTGYAGSGSSPDVGADEFAGVSPAPAYANVTVPTSSCTAVAHVITADITTPAGTITSAVLSYSYNGTAQSPIVMTNSSGNTWTATIPAATPTSAVVTWSVSGTNSASLTNTYNGTSYQDNPAGTASGIAQASITNLCSGNPLVLTAIISTPSTAPTGYCASAASSTSDEELTQVSIGSLNNITTCASLVGSQGTATGTADLYSNFTASTCPIPSLNAGSTYPLTVTNTECAGNNYTRSMVAWIDYNQNGSFADAGEQIVIYAYANPSATPHTVTTNITIPSTAKLGYTRMRVSVREADITAQTTPSCYTGSWGETEDYIVQINGLPTGSVTWTDASSNVVGTTDPLTITPTASNTYTCQMTYKGCPVITNGVSVTVNPSPTAPTATNSVQCGAGIPTASIASTTGVTGPMFNWYSAATGGTLLQTPPCVATLSTYYSNNFSSSTLSNSSLAGAAAIGSGVLTLQTATTSTSGGLQVNASGINSTAFQTDFDLSLTSTGTSMADGFSYSFADDASASSVSPSAEHGSGSKFKIGFMTYNAANGSDGMGIYLMYNCTLASGYTSTTPGILAYSTNVSWVPTTATTTTSHVTVSINAAGLCNVSVGGVPIFTNVQMPAAYLSAIKSNWMHIFESRAGGVAGGYAMDNLVIQANTYAAGSTTYNSSIATTTTLYATETNGACENFPRTPVTVTVNTPPAVTINALPAQLCGTGGNSVLTASSTDPNYVYTWSALDGGAFSPTTGSSTTTTQTATKGYQVSAVDNTPGANFGCTTTAVVSVGVYPFPAFTMTSTANPICLGAPAPTISSGLSASNFSVACIPYAPVNIPSNATMLAYGGNNNVTAGFTGSLDDGYWTGIPIGFNFNFFGSNKTTCAVGTNGTLMFGTPSTQYTFTGGFPNAGNPASTIAVCAMDLTLNNYSGTYPGSQILYWTQGIAPNRVFVLEYLNVPNCCAATNPQQTVQCLLYETTGNIEIHMLKALGTNAKYIGLQDATQTVGATATNCANNQVNYWNGSSSTIGSGGTYTGPYAWRFTPPHPYTIAWTPTASISGPSNGFTILANPTASGNITYNLAVTDQVTGCSNASSPATYTLTVVGAPPVAPTIANTNPLNLCGVHSVNLQANYTFTGGDTLRWFTRGGTTPVYQSGSSTVFPIPAVNSSIGYYVDSWNGVCSDNAGRVKDSVTFYVAPIISSLAVTPSSVCLGGSSVFTPTISTGQNYCTPTGTYCSSSGSTGNYLSQVSLNTMVHNTGHSSSTTTCYFYNIPAVANVTTTTLTAGTAYSMGFQQAVSDLNYVSAWIDYNNDGTFSSSEMVANSISLGTVINTTVSGGSFTVPSNTFNGIHRLRVILNYNAAPTDPCGVNPALTWTDIEDYDITVAGGITPTGLTYSWTPSTFLSATNTATVTASNVTAPTTYVFGVSNGVCTTYDTFSLSAGVQVTAAPTAVYNTGSYCSVSTQYGSDDGGSLPFYYGVLTNVSIYNGSTATGSPILNHSKAASLGAGVSYYAAYPATGLNTATLTAGNTYTLSVTSGYYNWVGIWIDMNDNGLFDASEYISLGSNSGGSFWTGTYTYTIPSTAYNGQHKMRLRTEYYGDPFSATSACGALFYGETEDYIISVTGGIPFVPCPLSAFQLTANGANGGAPYTYKWKSTPAGFTSTAANPIAYPSVTTTYSVTVYSTCGDSATGSAVATVQTIPVAISPATSSVCGSVPVTLNASGGTSYSWSPSIGLNTTTGATVIATPTLTVSYNTVNVTGYNNDIVASGTGSSSIVGVTYPAVGVDGAQYFFIDSTFRYVSTNALPTCYMPQNHKAASAITSGVNYTFQSYTANNALSIISTPTGYTSPLPTTGTLTLSPAASYSNLYVLYETVVNTGTPAINATVTFTDATTQVFNNNPVVNWFTATAPAYWGMGRTTPTGTIQCGTTPNMFELNLPISASNYSKQVASITFTFAAAAGTSVNTVNYFHAMAVSGATVPALPSSMTYTVTGTLGYCYNTATATINITAPPALTTTATPATICSGQSSTIGVSSSNSGYTYSWATPVSVNAATAVVSPTASYLQTPYTYSVTATDNSGGTYQGCIATKTVTVTVNPNPAIVSKSASPNPVCAGTPFALTASANAPMSGTVGTGSVQNTTTGYPTPYGLFYTSSHEQYLVLASELTALGFSAGNINSLAFNVVTVGSTTIGSYGAQAYTNYKISVASTSLTALSSTFVSSGFTNCYTSPVTFNPTTGWNTYTFQTPFSWNGTSNIVIDVSHINCSSCPGTACTAYSDNDVVNQTTTSFVSCTYVYADADCSVPTFTPSGTPSTISQRPNMQFNGIGNQTSSFTWSWNPGSLTGSTTSTSVSSTSGFPSIAQKYYVNATNSTTGCVGHDSVTVTVNEPPSITVQPVSTNGTACAYSSTSTFIVGATGSGSLIYQWQDSTATGWVNISNGTLANGTQYSGTTTSTLSVANAPYTMTGHKYHVTVNGGCNPLAVSNTVKLNLRHPASAVLSGSQSITIGNTATIQVALTGSAPWSVTLSDGSTYNNITTTPFAITKSPTQLTTYTIASLTDSSGCTTTNAADISGSAVVDVYAINDQCVSAIALNLTVSCAPVAGTSFNGHSSTTPTCTGSGLSINPDDDVWYELYIPAGLPSVTISVQAPGTFGNFDAAFEVLKGNCGALQSVACVNNSSVTTGSGSQEYIVLNTNLTGTNTTIYIRVYDARTGWGQANGGNGQFQICTYGLVLPTNGTPCTATNMSTNVGSIGNLPTQVLAYSNGVDPGLVNDDPNGTGTGLCYTASTIPASSVAGTYKPVAANLVYMQGTTAFAYSSSSTPMPPTITNPGGNTQKVVWFNFNAPTVYDATVDLNMNFANSATYSSATQQSNWIIALYTISGGGPCTSPVFTPVYYNGTTSPIYTTTGKVTITGADFSYNNLAGQPVYAELMLPSGAGGNYLMAIHASVPNITLQNPTTSTLTATWSGPFLGVNQQKLSWRARPNPATNWCQTVLNLPGYTFTYVPTNSTSYTINSLISGNIYDAWMTYYGTNSNAFNSKTATLGTTVGCSAQQPAPTILPVIGHCSRDTVKIPTLTLPLISSYPYRVYWYKQGSTGYSVVATNNLKTPIVGLQVNGITYNYLYSAICQGGASVVSATTSQATCFGAAAPNPNTDPTNEHTMYEVNGVYFVDMDIRDVIMAAEATHADLADGQVHYYPLHRVDAEGSVTTSTEMADVLTGGFDLIPNPTTNRVKVQYNLPEENLSIATIKLMDISGRVIRAIKLDNPTKEGYVSMDLTDLNSGIYLVNVQTEGYTETKKLVVSK